MGSPVGAGAVGQCALVLSARNRARGNLRAGLWDRILPPQGLALRTADRGDAPAHVHRLLDESFWYRVGEACHRADENFTFYRYDWRVATDAAAVAHGAELGADGVLVVVLAESGRVDCRAGQSTGQVSRVACTRGGRDER